MIALVVVFRLFLQSIHAFTGETEIASVRTISVDSASMRLELVPRGERTGPPDDEGHVLSPRS